MSSRLRSAAAGAVAAAVWALEEPLDQRLMGCDYSDVAVLGKGLTRSRSWRPVGLTAHAVNGAIFGLAFHEARRRIPNGPRKLALSMALAEHVSLYPLLLLHRSVPPRTRRAWSATALEEPTSVRASDVAACGVRHGARPTRVAKR